MSMEKGNEKVKEQERQNVTKFELGMKITCN